MLTPTVANALTNFYALGNTPAASLTRSLPQGVDASLLLLGCGDVRNVLYTAYTERGLPPRRLDFTCCDVVEDIHVRNIIFYSFLIDGLEDDRLDDLWDVYHHLYIEDGPLDLLRAQIEKLTIASETWAHWRESLYGRRLAFCDFDTFLDFRAVLARYDTAVASKDEPPYRQAFRDSLNQSTAIRNYMTGDEGAAIYTGLRSAAPLGVKFLGDLRSSFLRYWENGTTAGAPSGKTYPNPMFAASVSPSRYLHYGTEPIFGFHLAAGYANLTEASPLRVDPATPGFTKAAQAARTEFYEWAKAFREAAADNRVALRFVTADALVFCHTLQHRLSSGPTRRTAHWYRRQLDTRRLELDPIEYGRREGEYADGLPVPMKFEVIDTSNLADHLGTLNLLVAAAPLLSNTPFSTVHTELLLKRDESKKETFDRLLCGHGPTVALLLGLTPAEYYTNATTFSSVDELMMAMGSLTAPRSSNGPSFENRQLRSLLDWRLSHHFSGQARFQRRLNIAPADLAAILFSVYREMFYFENTARLMEMAKSSSSDKLRREQQNSAYPHFHRGSLAALMKFVEHRVVTDWEQTCRALIDLVFNDMTIMVGNNMVQDLATHLHIWGVHSESWLKHDIERDNKVAGGVSAWKQIPEVVAVTLVVPRDKIDRLFSTTGTPARKWASPLLQASIRSSDGAAHQWHNMFGDVHIAFGAVVPRGPRDSAAFVVEIEEDPAGWEGCADLVAFFYVPTASLQVEPRTAIIGLLVQTTMQNVMLYQSLLGIGLTIYETKLGAEGSVFFTRFLPRQEGYPVVCPPLPHLVERGQKKHDTDKAELTVNVDATTGRAISITGRRDMNHSAEAKELLEEKLPIELRQHAATEMPSASTSHFVIDIVFGKDDLVLPVHFPVPVLKEGSRTRIARKSGWIEVVAPLAYPLSSDQQQEQQPLSDMIFPSMLDLYARPTTLNIAHVNLDSLPILELSDKKAIAWLVTLASFTFSPREKLVRKAAREGSGISTDVRVNFKESLFSLFMLSSGLQGGQTGMFAVTHPGRGGEHMLLFVSALRLDGAAACVVADAAAMPLTPRALEDPDLRAFLALTQQLAVCRLTVDDAELALWKSVLPALAERCRDWNHGPGCEYRRRGATVPLSLAPGEPVLCSCGQGRLPGGFVGVPGWEGVARYATRIAVSPVFAVPFVEDLVDRGLMDRQVAATGGQAASLRTAVATAVGGIMCRNCSALEARGGGPLRKCMRCLAVKYCSAECQRKDWKKHKHECEEAEEYSRE